MRTNILKDPQTSEICPGAGLQLWVCTSLSFTELHDCRRVVTCLAPEANRSTAPAPVKKDMTARKTAAETTLMARRPAVQGMLGRTGVKANMVGVGCLSQLSLEPYGVRTAQDLCLNSLEAPAATLA